MTKRSAFRSLLSVLLTLTVLAVMIPVGLFSASAAPASGTSGTTGACTWTLDGTELTISGNGAMEDNFKPWGTEITRVTICDGVTSIGV